MRRALPPGATPAPKPQTRVAQSRGRAAAPAPDAQPVVPSNPQRAVTAPTLRGRDRHRLTLTVQ